ncbi:MAG TPA: threonylcarbamoyl-AMP synthase [Cytophagales bacterium]|nr:threonylcarbamoyl-AMP synthase [Cytophagales bacterium]HAA21000.1 threonylcarbamoyl-AMP synthase [Cytophagales bacterium]HAP61532.1 threonylcarbamoyl-AMP synthase [Cytophagales bacterium]
MAAELVRIHPDNPQMNKIRQVVKVLEKGGLIIYPTDTVYGLGCNIFDSRAVEAIARLKGVKPEKNNFSFICQDHSQVAEYVRQIDTPTFKLMKKAFPGPFTFILEASNAVPKLLNMKKKTVGIRMPNHQIPLLLVQELGKPLLTTSVHHNEDEIVEYETDPEEIYEKFKNVVDVVIDGGAGGNQPSTVVDLTDSSDYQVIRGGLGDFEQYR